MNEETLSTALTAPQDDAALTDTGASDAATEQTAAAEGATDTQPEGTTAEGGAVTTPTADTGTASAPPAEQAPFATYRYNHHTHEVKSLEDARVLMQKGRKYDDIVPQLDDLRFLAESRKQTLAEFIGDLKTSFDKSAIEKLKAEMGDNEEAARQLHEARMEKLRGSFKSLKAQEQEEAQQEEQALTERMGRELAELQKAFPDVTDLAALPREVVESAANGERALLDSYLRYLHRNGRKTAAEAKRQEENAASAVGGLKSEAKEADSASSSFAAGFWSAF